MARTTLDKRWKQLGSITTIPVVKRNTFTYLKERGTTFWPETLKNIKFKTKQGIHCRQYGDYGYTEGELIKPVERHLKQLAKNGEVVHFLDAGAGWGGAVCEAGAIDPSIRAHGLALNKPHAKLGIPGTNWTRGHFETTLFPGRFHVIQCCYGMQHAVNYAVSLENMLNSLRPEGKLYVFETHGTSDATLQNMSRFERDKIINILERQGFIHKFRRGDDYEDLEVFTRGKRSKIADLSKFYESRLVNRRYLVSKDTPKISPTEIRKRMPK